MPDLSQMDCEVCRRDAPAVDGEERASLLAEVPDWTVVTVDGVDRLVRRFSFADFTGALGFANRVGALAEAQGHHPALLVEWGSLTVSWWTHAIGGLHRNDFIMAARTDELAETP